MYNLVMRVSDVVWLPQVIDKLDWKHDVHPSEVEEVIFGPAVFRKVQKGNVPGEDVYSALGQTEAGRYLIVLFVYKISQEALILSAREMDNRERKYYERH
jgi:uncharacterized DUF497 family protein